MTKFIKEFSAFFILGILIIFTYHSTIAYFLYINTNHFKLEENIKTIIIGDSHTETSINTHYFKPAVNFSSKGEPVIFNYFKLKKIITHNPQVVNVIFAFSQHTLNTFQDDYMSQVAGDYFLLLDEEGMKDSFSDIESYYLILKSINKQLYKWFTSLVKTKNTPHQ